MRLCAVQSALSSALSSGLSPGFLRGFHWAIAEVVECGDSNAALQPYEQRAWEFK